MKNEINLTTCDEYPQIERYAGSEESNTSDVLDFASSLEASLDKLEDLSGNKNDFVLYSDITGGIATKLIEVINGSLDNREKARILNEIIQNEGFSLVHKNTDKDTVTKVFGTIKEKDVEFEDNINAAKALNKNGYDVYMLPKLSKSKSPDYIIAKAGKIYLAELKTIYGKNSIDHSLEKANEQADRIVLNIVGNITSRNVADEIKDFYLNNPHIREIVVLLGGKPIYVKYKHVARKNFTKTFMHQWAY